MNTIYLEANDNLKALAHRLFPDYRGKTFKAIAQERVSLNSHWEGGSREYFTVIRGTELASVGQYGTMFDPPTPVIDLDGQTIVVSHSIICGRDAGITLYVHPSVLPKLLPAGNQKLSWEQKVVLCATRSLKSSYGGEFDFRYREANRQTGIYIGQYGRAKEELIAMGLLNKAGAITVAGRNAIGNTDLWQLKEEAK